jgi:transcriptional regulator with XRE-family HTH domain
MIIDNWNMSQLTRRIISKNIKILREKSGYKREELSLLIGCDNSYISKLEKGKINITIDKLEDIATIFGIKVKNLLDED